MTCAQALERMLIAAPEALRRDGAAAGAAGSADADLVAHQAGCSRCRAVADALLAEMAVLDDALEEAGAAAGARRSGGRAGFWVPAVAAAAVLAAVLLTRGDEGPRAMQGRALAMVRDEAAVSVTLPPDRGGAVMQTMNPNITVVWLYERSEP